eukprot:134446-Pleurochrysis_carterae.AAC.5
MQPGARRNQIRPLPQREGRCACAFCYQAEGRAYLVFAWCAASMLPAPYNSMLGWQGHLSTE